MGLLLQQLGNQHLLNHWFIVEFVKVIPIEATRLANIGAGQNNNIVVFEVEVQDIQSKVARKKKEKTMGCQKSLETC